MTRQNFQKFEKHEFSVASGSKVVLELHSDVIAGIDFQGRPSLSSTQKKEYRGYEACHRVGLPIIKKEIFNDYVGKTLDTDGLCGKTSMTLEIKSEEKKEGIVGDSNFSIKRS
ncbi:hypothetical protein CbuD7D7780_05715 [Coxiella burnetii]|nr:hypothetical protein CbuD7E6568_05690 [Coxiella burnetii]OYK82339.1 hypothetical protein CbuD7D7780_05715 [Coxiella burnetii]